MQDSKSLPRRPVGLTSEKPSRSESTSLGEVFSSAPATSGREQSSIPAAARPQDQVVLVPTIHCSGLGVLTYPVAIDYGQDTP